MLFRECVFPDNDVMLKFPIFERDNKMPRSVERILPLIWASRLVLTFITVQAEVRDCTDSLRSCEDTYKTNILGPLNSKNKTKICHAFVVFEKCLKDLDCPIAHEDKQEKINKNRNELLKFNYTCDMEEPPKRNNEVKDRSRYVPVVVEEKEDQKCPSLIQFCKNEFMQSLHPLSGNYEAIENTKACNIAETFITCINNCTSKSTSVCEEFEQRNIHCGRDFTLCSQKQIGSLDTGSSSTRLQNTVFMLSLVQLGVNLGF